MRAARHTDPSNPVPTHTWNNHQSHDTTTSTNSGRIPGKLKESEHEEPFHEDGNSVNLKPESEED